MESRSDRLRRYRISLTRASHLAVIISSFVLCDLAMDIAITSCITKCITKQLFCQVLLYIYWELWGQTSNLQVIWLFIDSNVNGYFGVLRFDPPIPFSLNHFTFQGLTPYHSNVPSSFEAIFDLIIP